MKVNYNSAMQKFVAGLLAQLPLPLSDAYVHSTATDPLQKFMFAVKFVPSSDYDGDIDFSDENALIGFQKVSGLDWDLNVVEYHEGCTNYAMKLAGKAKFGEVTMEKGVIPYKSEEDLENTTNILDFLQATASDTTFRMDIVVQLLGRDGAIRAEYTLHDAFISKWEGPEGDATSDDVAIEKITVQYDYPTYTTNPTGTGNGERWDAQNGSVKYGS